MLFNERGTVYYHLRIYGATREMAKKKNPELFFLFFSSLPSNSGGYCS